MSKKPEERDPGGERGFRVVEFDCGDCGIPLVVVASSLRDSVVLDEYEPAPRGPYPTLFLTCPTCGCAWEQGADGVLTERRKRLDGPRL
jgi:hypothetical protein